MQIEKAVITRIVGRIKTIRGEAIIMEGVVEGRGEMAITAFRHEYPIGLISPHLMGVAVDVLVEKFGRHTVGLLAPFENQSPESTAVLFNALLKKADKAGQKAINRLPLVDRASSSIVRALEDSPDPRVEELNRLLEIDFPEPEHDQS